MASKNMKVAQIGLGNMGAALAQAVLNAGFDLTVWNRTRAKTEAFRSQGATISETVLAAAETCDVLVVSLLDHPATQAAMLSDDVGQALRGKVLIQLSTTTVEDVTDTMEWCAQYGIGFVKGGVLVYPSDIITGTGGIVYGGDRSLFDRMQPVLLAMGGQPMFVSDNPVDTISATSAAYAVIYSSLMSFILGTAICHRTGISVDTFTNNVVEPLVKSGALMNFFSRSGRAVHARNYDQDVQASLDVWIDAFRQTIAEIEEIGIETSSLLPLMDQLQRAEKARYGQKDIASVFETLIADHIST